MSVEKPERKEGDIENFSTPLSSVMMKMMKQCGRQAVCLG